MKLHFPLVCTMMLLCLANVALAAQDAPASSATWSGVLINSTCNVDEAFNEAAKCSANPPGTKLELYADSIRQVYQLDPQSKVTNPLGDSVTVTGGGSLGGTVRFTSHSHKDVCGSRPGCRPKSTAIFVARPVWPRADPRNTKGIEGNRPAVLPLRRLVPVLQRPTRSIAISQSAIREARNQAGGHQL